MKTYKLVMEFQKSPSFSQSLILLQDEDTTQYSLREFQDKISIQQIRRLLHADIFQDILSLEQTDSVLTLISAFKGTPLQSYIKARPVVEEDVALRWISQLLHLQLSLIRIMPAHNFQYLKPRSVLVQDTRLALLPPNITSSEQNISANQIHNFFSDLYAKRDNRYIPAHASKSNASKHELTLLFNQLLRQLGRVDLRSTVEVSGFIKKVEQNLPALAPRVTRVNPQNPFGKVFLRKFIPKSSEKYQKNIKPISSQQQVDLTSQPSSVKILRKVASHGRILIDCDSSKKLSSMNSIKLSTPNNLNHRSARYLFSAPNNNVNKNSSIHLRLNSHQDLDSQQPKRDEQQSNMFAAGLSNNVKSRHNLVKVPRNMYLKMFKPQFQSEKEIAKNEQDDINKESQTVPLKTDRMTQRTTAENTNTNVSIKALLEKKAPNQKQQSQPKRESKIDKKLIIRNPFEKKELLNKLEELDESHIISRKITQLSESNHSLANLVDYLGQQ